jgi:dipeptidase
MDLIRLALERAETAERAVEVITELLETHGQGGGCGHEDRNFTYHNSFIVADPEGAFVLETAGKLWETERIAGPRSISNGLTIPGFAETHSDFIKTRVSGCRARQARTLEMAHTGESLGDLMGILRDHGPDAEVPHYSWINGGMTYPCMHGGGVLASSQTTASWVAELTPTGVQHWVTATAAPCTSLFKPVSATEPLDLGMPPTDRADGSLWWKHERFHRLVVKDPVAAMRVFGAERDSIEADWRAHPPEPADAFAKHAEFLEKWTPEVEKAVGGGDVRPGYVRRYWAKRAERAGLAARVHSKLKAY